MTDTPSIDATEAASAAVAKAPRISADSIKARIKETYFVNAYDAVCCQAAGTAFPPDDSPLKIMTLCILVMDNGFVVIGKTAPASPENFNADLGQQFSLEDAIRQLWPLCGFELRTKLAGL